MWFALFAAVLGVGNGLSSGILLTLGADVAPQDDPAPFLGSWRTLTDAGGAIAPCSSSPPPRSPSRPEPWADRPRGSGRVHPLGAAFCPRAALRGSRPRGAARRQRSAVRLAAVAPSSVQPSGTKRAEDGRAPVHLDADAGRYPVGRRRRHEPCGTERVEQLCGLGVHAVVREPGHGPPPSIVRVKPSAPARAAASAAASARFCVR
jgi:hypothetical protein